MDIVIFIILGAFLVKKLYNILGNEDGFIQNSFNGWDNSKPKEVEEILPPINNDEDIELVKTFDEDSLSILNEIKRSDTNFTVRALIENSKKIVELTLRAISENNLNLIKDYVSTEMFENLEDIEKTMNNKISIVSFEKIKVASIKKIDTIYFIELDIKMLQHLIDKDAKVSVLDVFEKWTFQKMESNREPNWILTSILDNNE